MPERFEDRLSELKRLPPLEPPAHLEARTLEAMAEASASRRTRPLALAAGWIAAVGIGVLLGALVVGPERSDEPEIESAAAEEAYHALLEESEYLERLLAELPQRQVMRVSTAGTIVGLEERLALIDAALARQRSEDVSPAYRLALMQDRVETMNALVIVRYAQSPAFGY